MEVTPRSRAVLASLLLPAVLVGCGGESADGAGDDATSSTSVDVGDDGVVTEPPTAEPSTTRPDLTVPPEDVRDSIPPPSMPPGADPASDPQIVAAVSDLADRLGIDPALVAVVGWEEVTWRNGSLGCPRPGFAYTQALVDGMRVVLEYDGVRYSYHAAGAQDPFLCEHPTEPTG